MTEMKQGVIKSILLASPPGQFDIILDDLRTLLPESSVSTLLGSSVVSDLRTEWEATSGRSILSAASSAVNSGTDDDSQGYIAALSKAMDSYIANDCTSLGVRAAHTVTISAVEADRTLKINTYAEKNDLQNCRAVSWKGYYTISLPPSSTSNILMGKIDLRVHTFENGGNFHLRSTVSLRANIKQGISTASDDSEQQSVWVSSVIQQMEYWDRVEVTRNIAEMFDSLHNTYMKRLRRVMPITRTKMDWNVACHRVVRTLCEGQNDKR
jgi:hypothetical protein